MKHSKNCGRPVYSKPKNQLDKHKVKEIRLMLKSGMTGRDIAEKFGVHHSSIYDIKNGRTWSYKRKVIAKEIQRKSVAGSKNHFAKLNEKDVRQIRKCLAKKCYTQISLAIHYNVTASLISAINVGKLWKDVG